MDGGLEGESVGIGTRWPRESKERVLIAAGPLRGRILRMRWSEMLSPSEPRVKMVSAKRPQAVEPISSSRLLTYLSLVLNLAMPIKAMMETWAVMARLRKILTI